MIEDNVRGEDYTLDVEYMINNGIDIDNVIKTRVIDYCKEIGFNYLGADIKYRIPANSYHEAVIFDKFLDVAPTRCRVILVYGNVFGYIANLYYDGRTLNVNMCGIHTMTETSSRAPNHYWNEYTDKYHKLELLKVRL